MAKPPTVVDLTWAGDLVLSGTSDKTSMTLDSAGIAGPSPVQALAFALAGCMTMDVAYILTKGRQPFHALRSHLIADRAPDDPHRIVRMHLHVTVEGDVPADAVARAIALSHEKHCSVWHSMRQDIVFTTTHEVRGRESFSGNVMGENDSRPRLSYVDWARGIAVLLMIEAHTADAWTRLNVRRTIAFRDATVLGGFAAPLFLWLAGLAVVLAATRAAERTGSRRVASEMICRRGLEIFILGFLFRLQGFIITPGSHPVTLFRVDILNIMGPAIAVAGLVWGLAGTAAARVFWYAAIAAAFAMVTPIVRASHAVDALPLWLQWYARPAGELTIFTLFPWAGFVFAGGAVGALIAAAREERAERRLHAILGASGIALVTLGFYAARRPSIYASSSFWTSSPTWFAIRLGILMMSLTAIYACEALTAALKGRATRREAPGRVPAAAQGRATTDEAPGRVPELAQGFSPAIDPLARLGRSSLFIYWIHVELVYGYASWMWRHRLPLWGWAIAFTLFCVLMYRAIGWRDLAVGKWRNRSRGARSATQTAPA